MLATLPGGAAEDELKTYLIPSPPTSIIPRWYGPGDAVVVAELVLPGMVRVGASSAAGRPLHDPSMIDPGLPVDRSSTICTLLNDGALDYATLAPRDRGAYLNWLVGGRRSPVPAGLPLLFFKGLERRAFEIHSAPGAADESDALAAEMRALVTRYGQQSCLLMAQASDLSTLLEIGLGCARSYTVGRKPPRFTFSQSFELRLAIAQAAFDLAPLPADWALDWALHDASSTVRTSALRCEAELARLFRARYQERYGHGIKLPSNGGQLALSYSPVSQAIQRGKTLSLIVKSTADVPGFIPVRRELGKLVESCLDELSAFGRLAGRSPGAAATLDGLVRLPVAAWPDDATEWFMQLKAEVHQAPKQLSLDVLRRRFGGASTLPKEGLAALFKAFEGFGVGVEPLELATRSEVFTAETIALFPDSGAGGQYLDSDEFRTASNVVNLAIALATSGGEMTTEDRAAIAAEVKRYRRLKPGHIARLKARFEVVRGASIDIKGALKQLTACDDETRLETVNFLTRLAFRDVDSTRARSAALNQFRAALTPATKTVTAPLRPASPAPRRAALSPSPRASRPEVIKKRLTLDPNRVAVVQEETAKVAKLLHTVFTDEDESRPAAQPAKSFARAQSLPSALLLDASHGQLLKDMLNQRSWAREELQKMVAKYDLMLDGAIETLNEAAFDAFGAGLIEGDDPFEINSEVERLILQAAAKASRPTTE